VQRPVHLQSGSRCQAIYRLLISLRLFVTTESHPMNSSLRKALLTGTVMLLDGTLQGKMVSESGPARVLPIRLYNQAQVPNRVLGLATSEAERLFRAARLRIVWERPSESEEDRGTDMISFATRGA
jgi:hypothetical protein